MRRAGLVVTKLSVLAAASGVFSAVAVGGEEPSYGLPELEVTGVAPGEKRPGDRVVEGIHSIPIQRSSGLLDYGTTPNGQSVSSHGPDPLPEDDEGGEESSGGDAFPGAPEGDPAPQGDPLPLGGSEGGSTGSSGSVQCLPQGQDRYYETLYYVPSGQSASADVDRLADEVEKAVSLLQAEAATVGDSFRNLYLNTDADCNPLVETIQGTQGSTSFGSVIGDVVTNFGKQDPRRKYIIFVQGGGGCGVASMFDDASKSSSNKHNQRTGWALVYPACRDNAGRTVLHEVAHNLSAVQADYPGHPGAPNNNTLGTPANANDVRWHCVDESDRMCYDENQPAEATQSVCDDGREWFDCNHDDYFNPNPPTNSWLATHFNMANDAFLVTPTDWTDPVWLAEPAFEDVSYQSLLQLSTEYLVHMTAHADDNWKLDGMVVERSKRKAASLLDGCPQSGYEEDPSGRFEIEHQGETSDQTVDVTDGWGISQAGCYRFRVTAVDRGGNELPAPSDAIVRVSADVEELDLVDRSTGPATGTTTGNVVAVGDL